MDIYQSLSLEQKFELKVFEDAVRQLSQQDAQALVIELKKSMMHQKTAFQEILKDSWGMGKDFNTTKSIEP